MATYYPDADLRNADWPKRTPDTFEALGMSSPVPDAMDLRAENEKREAELLGLDKEPTDE